MRRAPVDDDENMDSLLDTLMNVVGILIIVLVVTQLGVGDAVKRIGETLAVDPATLRQAEEELVSFDRQRDRLKVSAQDQQQVDPEVIVLAMTVSQWYADGVSVAEAGQTLLGADASHRRGLPGQHYQESEKRLQKSVNKINQQGAVLRAKMSKKYNLPFPALK